MFGDMLRRERKSFFPRDDGHLWIVGFEVCNYPQRACARGLQLVTFSVCLSVTYFLILMTASFYLSKRASQHSRRRFKGFKCSFLNLS